MLDKYHHHHHHRDPHPHPHDALVIPATYFPHHWPVAHHPSNTTSTRQYLYHSQSNVAAFPHYYVSQLSATAMVKVEITPIPPNTALDQHSPIDSAPVTDEGEGGGSNNNNDDNNNNNNNNNGHSAKHHSGNTHTSVIETVIIMLTVHIFFIIIIIVIILRILITVIPYKWTIRSP